MTQCIAAPGPDDPALLAYNEGNGDVATAEHLRRCSHCRARAETLAKREAQLRALFHRINCPSTEELQDYHFDFLPAAQIAAITLHVQTCPHCMRELTTLARFLESDPEELFGPLPTQANQTTALQGSVPPALVQEKAPGQDEAKPGMAQRIRTVIATWLQGGQGGMTPALAGLRGQENSHQFYLAGDLQIGIDIQRDPKQANRRELLGSVLGLDLAELMQADAAAPTDGSPPRPVWQAHLWRDGMLIASAPLQELGSFVFAGLLPNEYELNISGPNLAINIASLTVT